METKQLKHLGRELKNMAIGMGARFFGVADLSGVVDTVKEQGGDYLSAFPRALSVGIALNDGIVDQLAHHKKESVAKTYDYLYDTVNQSLDRIALRLGAVLSHNGFASHLIPASSRTDSQKIQGLFSHKLAARLSGLGWIGPSCLLITPELGPRVRWVSVLTDALLAFGKPMSNQCGDCQKCVEACPPKAFSGRPFDPAEHRDVRFNVQRCIDYRLYLRDKVTGVRVCGMCVHVCPFGSGQARTVNI